MASRVRNRKRMTSALHRAPPRAPLMTSQTLSNQPLPTADMVAECDSAEMQEAVQNKGKPFREIGVIQLDENIDDYKKREVTLEKLSMKQ